MPIIYIDNILSSGLLKLYSEHILLSICNETIIHSCSNFGCTDTLIRTDIKLGINYNESIISHLSIKQLIIKRKHLKYVF